LATKGNRFGESLELAVYLLKFDAQLARFVGDLERAKLLDHAFNYSVRYRWTQDIAGKRRQHGLINTFDPYNQIVPADRRPAFVLCQAAVKMRPLPTVLAANNAQTPAAHGASRKPGE